MTLRLTPSETVSAASFIFEGIYVSMLVLDEKEEQPSWFYREAFSIREFFIIFRVFFVKGTPRFSDHTAMRAEMESDFCKVLKNMRTV